MSLAYAMTHEAPVPEEETVDTLPVPKYLRYLRSVVPPEHSRWGQRVRAMEAGKDTTSAMVLQPVDPEDVLGDDTLHVRAPPQATTPTFTPRAQFRQPLLPHTPEGREDVCVPVSPSVVVCVPRSWSVYARLLV